MNIGVLALIEYTKSIRFMFEFESFRYGSMQETVHTEHFKKDVKWTWPPVGHNSRLSAPVKVSSLF